MNKERRRNKAVVIILAAAAVLVVVVSLIILQFVPKNSAAGVPLLSGNTTSNTAQDDGEIASEKDDGTKGEATDSQQENEGESTAQQNSAGKIKLRYCISREAVQPIIDRLEALSFQVDSVSLTISFEKSEIYATEGALKTEDIKNILSKASFQKLTDGEGYDYIIYIGLDYTV